MKTSLTRISSLHHGGMNGLTLLEIMITVAIIGILAAIAIPSYNYYTRTSHRTIAKNALLDLASREQKYYSVNNAYTADMTQLGYTLKNNIPLPNSTNTYYTLKVTVPAPGISSPSFIAQAVAQGTQVKDNCGSYLVNSLGQQTASASNCW